MKKMLLIATLMLIPMAIHAGKDKDAALTNKPNTTGQLLHVECPWCGKSQEVAIYSNAKRTVLCLNDEEWHQFTVDTRNDKFEIY